MFNNGSDFIVLFLLIAMIAVGVLLYLFTDGFFDHDKTSHSTKADEIEAENEAAQERRARADPVTSMNATIRLDEQTCIVELDLLISERERAAIQQSRMHEEPVEQYPLFAAADLSAKQQHFDELIENEADPAEKRNLRRRAQQEIDLMKAQRSKVFIGDYLRYPYTREFTSITDARQYRIFLEKKILELKREIDGYLAKGQTTTMEL